MFKKSLMALALVGAAAAAQAGNVQVYGVVDAGFDFSQTKLNATATSIPVVAGTPITVDSVSKSTSTTKLATGKHSGNRFGIKGTEDINDNLKAGFVLEGGFDLLNGDMADKGKLFNRQADLFIEGDFGHLAFGRVGTLTSANGTYGFFGNITDNFGGGWGNTIGAGKNVFAQNGRIDNSVTYVSPEIVGVKLYTQYSFNMKGEQNDKLRKNDRYAAIGASFKHEGLELAGVFDKTFHNNNEIVYDATKYKKESVISDAWSLNLGGAYDFDAFKVFAAYQHADHTYGFGPHDSESIFNNFKDMNINSLFLKEVAEILAKTNYKRIEMMINQSNGIKSNSFAFGFDVPLNNGVIKAQAFYGKAKLHNPYKGSWGIENFSMKARTTGLAMGYEHNLSKRTQLYFGAGYSETKTTGKVSFKAAKKIHTVSVPLTKKYSLEGKMKNFEAVAGLVHKF